MSTDARRRANQKFLTEKVETLAVRVPKGRKDYYKDMATAAGMSFNSFAVTALDEKIKRDHLTE